jgi:hypothetical protein
MHKMAAMRQAWSSVPLHTDPDRLHSAVLAFKANKLERQRDRRVLSGAVAEWHAVAVRSAAATALRRRIKQVRRRRIKQVRRRRV